jgi:hypothetical protein
MSAHFGWRRCARDRIRNTLRPRRRRRPHECHTQVTRRYSDKALKNVMMAGGLLQIAAFGAGAFGLDRRFSKSAVRPRASRRLDDALGFAAIWSVERCRETSTAATGFPRRQIMERQLPPPTPYPLTRQRAGRSPQVKGKSANKTAYCVSKQYRQDTTRGRYANSASVSHSNVRGHGWGDKSLQRGEISRSLMDRFNLGANRRAVPSRRWLELGWRSLRVAQPK